MSRTHRNSISISILTLSISIPTLLNPKTCSTSRTPYDEKESNQQANGSSKDCLLSLSLLQLVYHPLPSKVKHLSIFSLSCSVPGLSQSFTESAILLSAQNNLWFITRHRPGILGDIVMLFNICIEITNSYIVCTRFNIFYCWYIVFLFISEGRVQLKNNITVVFDHLLSTN